MPQAHGLVGMGGAGQEGLPACLTDYLIACLTDDCLIGYSHANLTD